MTCLRERLSKSSSHVCFKSALTVPTPALKRIGSRYSRSWWPSNSRRSSFPRRAGVLSFDAFGAAGLLPLGVVTTGTGSGATSSAFSPVSR